MRCDDDRPDDPGNERGMIRTRSPCRSARVHARQDRSLHLFVGCVQVGIISTPRARHSFADVPIRLAVPSPPSPSPTKASFTFLTSRARPTQATATDLLLPAVAAAFGISCSRFLRYAVVCDARLFAHLHFHPHRPRRQGAESATIGRRFGRNWPILDFHGGCGRVGALVIRYQQRPGPRGNIRSILSA